MFFSTIHLMYVTWQFVSVVTYYINNFSAYVQPICLPLSLHDKNKNFVGKKLTVAGWGKTENKSNSNIKLKVKVSSCSYYYLHTPDIFLL